MSSAKSSICKFEPETQSLLSSILILGGGMYPNCIFTDEFGNYFIDFVTQTTNYWYLHDLVSLFLFIVGCEIIVVLELLGLVPGRTEQLVERNHQEAGGDDEGDPVETHHGEGCDGEGETVEKDGHHREIFSLHPGPGLVLPEDSQAGGHDEEVRQGGVGGEGSRGQGEVLAPGHQDGQVEDGVLQPQQRQAELEADSQEDGGVVLLPDPHGPLD